MEGDGRQVEEKNQVKEDGVMKRRGLSFFFLFFYWDIEDEKKRDSR